MGLGRHDHRIILSPNDLYVKLGFSRGFARNYTIWQALPKIVGSQKGEFGVLSRREVK
jgi:hypothetical protein